MGRSPLLRVLLLCWLIWGKTAAGALAWGPVAHVVIAELAENVLLKQDQNLRALLSRFQQPTQRQRVRRVLLGLDPPAPGQALRIFANWPDTQRGEPGMLPLDGQRHYVNLPHHAVYNRAQYCPEGVCSLETLLHQRRILADRKAPVPQRAVALAWVTHLVGDMHQPLHAGKAEDRGGNLTCTAWMGQLSQLTDSNGQKSCSGVNLHAVWDSKILEEVTGVTHADDTTALTRALADLLPLVKASEPPFRARTEAEWRAVVERWHSETQALIVQMDIYPHGNVIDECYIQSHYHTVRLQLLRAAVRLATLLQHTLAP